MNWLHDYAEKAGFKVSNDIISSDEDLTIILETFAGLVAHEVLKQYIAEVYSAMRNGQTLH